MLYECRLLIVSESVWWLCQEGYPLDVYMFMYKGLRIVLVKVIVWFTITSTNSKLSWPQTQPRSLKPLVQDAGIFDFHICG
jgi:hypothetical protein